MKEYPFDDLQQFPELEQFLARGLLLGEDARLQNNPYLLFPHAYALHDDKLLVVLERADEDLQAYLAFVKTRWPAMLGARIGETLLAAAKGLAALHDAGYTHRDVKPSNLLINRDGWRVQRVRWTDFDLLGEEHRAQAAGPTTIFSDRDGVMGTFEYLPERIWRGTVSIKDAPRMLLDNYAFGRMIAELAFDEDLEAGKLVGVETRLERRRGLRASSDLEALAEKLCLPGLEQIMVRATDEYRGYESMHEIVEDLERVVYGDKQAVRRKKPNKIAWRYRKGEAEGKRVEQKERRRRAGIALFTSALAAGVLSKPAERVLYGTTVEASARAAADLSEKNIDAFLQKEAKKVADDIKKQYLPLLNDPSNHVFPYGSFPNSPTYFFTGRDTPSEHFLELLRTEWLLTGDEKFLQWYARYMEKMDVEAGTPYGDEHCLAAGRYASLLRHIPEDIVLLQNEHPELMNIWRNTYAVTLANAALALRQYDPATKTFHDPLMPPQESILIDVDQEHFLLPFIVASSLSDDVDKILDPGLSRSTSTAFDMVVKGLPPLHLSDLYQMIAESGVTVSNALVTPEGRSFGQARVYQDRVEQRAKRNIVPGSAEQATLAQEHAQIILAMAYRIDALSRTFAQDTAFAAERQKRLRTELGTAYEAFAAKMHSDLAMLRAREDSLIQFYEERTGGSLPHEYLALPGGTNNQGDTGTFGQQDILAAVIYSRALHVLGREKEFRTAMSRILMQGSFNRDILSHHPGLLMSARGYIRQQTGSLIEADAYLLQNIRELKKIKK